jgi:phage recombination protein Bet
MEKTNTLVRTSEEKTAEFVPYGASDKIRLSAAIVQNLIAVKTKSGKTCSEREAIRFVAMCVAKRLNPFEGDCFLIGYDSKDGPTFSLVTAHQTYLKRAELHPEFDGMDSGVIVLCEDGTLKDLPGDFYEEGQKVVGGWATVYFKSRKHPMVKRLRMSTFNKGYGQWNENANGMIVKCAESDALRSSFPTMLGGLYLREEVDLGAQFAKPDFGTSSKPLFSSTVEIPAGESEPTLPPALAAPSEPEPTHPDEGDLGPQTSATPQPESSNGFNPLKALRGLLGMAKVSEGTLLDFWAATGVTDGSAGSLEEIGLSKGQDWLTNQTESWPATAEKIRAAKKKGKA